MKTTLYSIITLFVALTLPLHKKPQMLKPMRGTIG